MEIKIEINISEKAIYCGVILDDNGNEIDRTRRYFNRKNARAAAVALLIDLQPK